MTFLKKHWQATAIVAIAALLIISGWRMFSQSAQIIDLGIFMLLGVALLLMPIAGLAEQILRKLGEQTVAVSSRERSHRQELELALAHGMGALVANPTFPGKSVGNNIRDALDAMLVQSAPASLAELRCGMNAYPGRADQHKCLVHGVAACPCHKASDDLMRSAGYEGEQAPASGGPRVTLADIEAEIVGEHYFTAEQGARHPDAQNPLDFGDIPGNLGLLTFCVLRLRNGFTVTGESACASPENFDAAIGRRIARENAVQKIWPLLGFRLRDKLAGINDPSKAERVLGEVLSVVQHYLPPDGGTAHDAMGKIIGLVDPWPLGAASAAAALLSSAGVDSGHMDSTAPASRVPTPLEVAAEEYARAEQNLSMASLRARRASEEVRDALSAESDAMNARATALGKLTEAALPKHPDAGQS